MRNVRIKKAPGDQVNYELVDMYAGFNDFTESVPRTVKDKLYPVDREEANMEAERGETIIGDINLDGYLELMDVMGEKHSKGGTPLSVPEGSFVFSDTKDLTIKDPEILEMFGMPKNKKGYTPAKISKKFKINDYIEVAKDESADPISRRSASMMIQNNAQKLAELALIQESMKDFEYGIPEFAQQILDLPEAKYGGALTKYQVGGNTIVDEPEEKKKIETSKGDFGADKTGTEEINSNDTISKKYPLFHTLEKHNELKDLDYHWLSHGLNLAPSMIGDFLDMNLQIGKPRFLAPFAPAIIGANIMSSAIRNPKENPFTEGLKESMWMLPRGQYFKQKFFPEVNTPATWISELPSSNETKALKWFRDLRNQEKEISLPAFNIEKSILDAKQNVRKVSPQQRSTQQRNFGNANEELMSWD